MADLKRKRPMSNYDFTFGMGVNWVDMDSGVIYHIQEYKEALARGEKPKGIRMTKVGNGTEIGYKDPVIVAELMKDPDPDPRYSEEPMRRRKKL